MESFKLKLLIIDDEQLISRILKDFFEDCDAEVLTAASGEESIKLISENEFNAAIVDMRLPDITGNDLIIKLHEKQPHIKFFIHTGSLDYKITPEIREIGITEDQVIYKPITDMMEVYNKIINLCESSLN